MTTKKNHPVLDTANDAKRFIQCDPEMRMAMWQQIPVMTRMAISGGRVKPVKYGISMPVSSGMAVEVLMAADDTYVVRRTFTRKQEGVPVTFDHGERTNVYCDDLGEVCYYASCYKSYEDGDWQHKA
jgi:hypothetical protein